MLTKLIVGLLVGVAMPRDMAGAGEAAPVVLDLPQAVSRALQFNRDLGRAYLGLRSQEEGVRGAQGEFAVRVGPDAAISSSDTEDNWQYGMHAAKKLPWGTEVAAGGRVRETRADLSGLSGDVTDPVLEEEFSSQRTELEVGLTQPLFRNFGRLVHEESVRQAGSALRAARRGYENSQAQLVLGVVRDFEEILRLERSAILDEEALARLDRLVRLSKAKERQGRASRVDTMRLTLQMGVTEARLSNSRESLRILERDLNEKLGSAPETPLELIAPPLLELQETTVGEAVAVALSNRMDVAQSLDDERDRKRGVLLARRYRYPDLLFNTRLVQFSEDETIVSPEIADDQEWSVNLLAVTELNPAQDRAVYAQARIEAEDAGQAVEILRSTVARQVQQALLNYRRTRQDLKYAERNTQLARSRQELSRRLFQRGRIDSFSVSDAEETFAQAESQRLSAQAQASIAAYDVLAVLGQLVDHPSDLKPESVLEGDAW